MTPRTTASGSLARRSLLGAGAAGMAALLAACTTGPSTGGSAGTAAGSSDGGAAAAGAYPRTVKHALGETRLEKQPQRVVTISWVNPDVVLALGVVPVGVESVTWGGNDAKSTDWFDAELEKQGGAAPEQFSATDGIATDAIAALTPDLIVAAYSGLDAEQYAALEAIAPTLAYPEGSGPWSTSWQDSVTLVGEALAREDAAAALIEDVEGAMSTAAADNPALEGTTFIYGTIDPTAADQISIYTDADNRPKFLQQLGMVNAPVVTENQPADGAFFMSWSAEKADELVSDVLLSWFNDAAAVDAVVADPLLGQIPAIKNGTFVAQSDAAEVLSISAASPLSIPWAIENVVPEIVAAAQKSKSL